MTTSDFGIARRKAVELPPAPTPVFTSSAVFTRRGRTARIVRKTRANPRQFALSMSILAGKKR